MDHNTLPAARFSAVALYWLLAVALLGIFCFGLYTAGLPFSPRQLKIINWHKWAGITILALSVLRLLWHLTHCPRACRCHAGLAARRAPCHAGCCSRCSAPCR